MFLTQHLAEILVLLKGKVIIIFLIIIRSDYDPVYH